MTITEYRQGLGQALAAACNYLATTGVEVAPFRHGVGSEFAASGQPAGIR